MQTKLILSLCQGPDRPPDQAVDRSPHAGVTVVSRAVDSWRPEGGPAGRGPTHQTREITTGMANSRHNCACLRSRLLIVTSYDVVTCDVGISLLDYVLFGYFI